MNSVNIFLKCNKSWWLKQKDTSKSSILEKEIPWSGKVESKSRPKLEQLRKTINAYNRFYNDGASYRNIHQIVKRLVGERPYEYTCPYTLEETMDYAIEEAWQEHLAVVGLDVAVGA